MSTAKVRTRIDSKERVTIRGTRKQEIEVKPRGFWYSVDGGWQEWCSSEMPHWLEKKYEHEVTLGDENILFIGTVLDLDLFHDKYKARLVPTLPLDYIDWRQVAKEYDGIEIAPYQWARRLDGPTRWYYGWDCASGCIWRPRGATVKSGSLCKPKAQGG